MAKSNDNTTETKNKRRKIDYAHLNNNNDNFHEKIHPKNDGFNSNENTTTRTHDVNDNNNHKSPQKIHPKNDGFNSKENTTTRTDAFNKNTNRKSPEKIHPKNDGFNSKENTTNNEIHTTTTCDQKNLYQLIVQKHNGEITDDQLVSIFGSQLDKDNNFGVLFLKSQWRDEVLVEKSKIWEIKSHKQGINKRLNKIIGITSGDGLIHGQVLIKAMRQSTPQELKKKKNQKKHQIKSKNDIAQYIDSPNTLWVWEFDPGSVVLYPHPLKCALRGQIWSLTKLSDIKLNNIDNDDDDDNDNDNDNDNNFNKKTDCLVSSYKAVAPLPLYLQPTLITNLDAPTTFALQSQQNAFSNDALSLQTRLKFKQILSYELINELAHILFVLLHTILNHNAEIKWVDVYTKIYLITCAIPLIPKTPETALDCSKWNYVPPTDWNRDKLSWCTILRSFITHRKEIIQCINDEKVVYKFEKLFDAFESEFNLHDKIEEYIGPTVPDVNSPESSDPRIQEANITTKWSRAKCPSCWGPLSNVATEAPIRCAICALLNNRHCPDCIAAAGEIGNVPIGPQCQEKLLNVKNFDPKSISKIFNDPKCKLKITLSVKSQSWTQEEKNERGLDGDVDFIQFIPYRYNNRVYAKGVLIKDRFAVIDKNDFVNFLGETNYNKLIHQWRTRKKYKI